jgi:hypothetical protein
MLASGDPAATVTDRQMAIRLTASKVLQTHATLAGNVLNQSRIIHGLSHHSPAYHIMWGGGGEGRKARSRQKQLACAIKLTQRSFKQDIPQFTEKD